MSNHRRIRCISISQRQRPARALRRIGFGQRRRIRRQRRNIVRSRDRHRHLLSIVAIGRTDLKDLSDRLTNIKILGICVGNHIIPIAIRINRQTAQRRRIRRAIRVRAGDKAHKGRERAVSISIRHRQRPAVRQIPGPINSDILGHTAAIGITRLNRDRRHIFDRFNANSGSRHIRYQFPIRRLIFKRRVTVPIFVGHEIERECFAISSIGFADDRKCRHGRIRVERAICRE